jgi:prevent-host-death family protein
MWRGLPDLIAPAKCPLVSPLLVKFSQRASEAKRAARQGPVVITDRGRPAYVLLTIEDYRALTALPESIGALLTMPDVGDFELCIPLRRDLPKAADLD